MGLNEEEIPSVSDKSPISAKQHKIKSKRTVESILADIPPPSLNYTSVSVADRPSKSLAKGLADSPLELFQLFISAQHCRIIAYHTNIKAHDYIKKENENNHRAWDDVIRSEIEVFLGILLFMSLYHAPSKSDFWNTCFDKPVFVSIQEAMFLNRLPERIL